MLTLTYGLRSSSAMNTHRLTRRALSDAVSFATLAILVALLMSIISSTDTPAQRWNSSLAIYGVLGVSGYLCWLRDKEQARVRWITEALVSIALGILILLPDILFGHFWNPSLPALEAATKTGMMFGITLCACPGYTLIALSGWVRSLILYHTSPRIRVH
jgi:hypothetical protein